MKWFILALKKYADFSGRSRRKEYWMFALFHVLISYALLFIAGATAVNIEELKEGVMPTGVPAVIAILLIVVPALVLFIPSLAVLVRRLHDVDKSGWYYFMSLIPIAGPIILLIALCKDSTEGTNKWGVSPKYATNDVEDHLVA